MSKLSELEKQYLDINTVEEVTAVFENIASIQVRQIKDRVIASRQFFHELWSLYAQLRLDSSAPSVQPAQSLINKTAVILISSEESLSGRIDEQLVDEVLDATDPAKADYYVIGRRGARLLKSRGVKPAGVFGLPDITKPVNVVGIIGATEGYKSTVVYFEQFVSLQEQQIQVFELIQGVAQLSELELNREDTTLIFSSDYIFEPSLEEVVLYLESMMRATALTELILESRLAQLASRFQAMGRANRSASKLEKQLRLRYARQKRSDSDSESRLLRYGGKVII